MLNGSVKMRMRDAGVTAPVVCVSLRSDGVGSQVYAGVSAAGGGVELGLFV